MDNNKTPKPDSEAYQVDKPQKLNTPKFNSSTEKRNSHEFPATENLNDQKETDDRHDPDLPDTDLGNEPDENEHERERIIRK